MEKYRFTVLMAIAIISICCLFSNCGAEAQSPNVEEIDTPPAEEIITGDSFDIKIPYQDSVNAEEQPKIDIIGSEPDLTSWKIPNVVIHKMGDIENQTIADIGAGVGYFAFRLVLSKANVIAVDIEPSSIDLLNFIAMSNLSEEQSARFQTRLAKANDPLLEENEVDKAILMHLIGFIDNKQEYLSNLRRSIKPGGQVMIMDFKMKRLPEGYPSKEYRMYPDVLEELLYELGYTDIQIDDTTLDLQYILIATNPS